MKLPQKLWKMWFSNFQKFQSPRKLRIQFLVVRKITYWVPVPALNMPVSRICMGAFCYLTQVCYKLASWWCFCNTKWSYILKHFISGSVYHDKECVFYLLQGVVGFCLVVLLLIFFLNSIMGQMLNPFMSKAKFDLNETRMHGYVLNQIFLNACLLRLQKEKHAHKYLWFVWSQSTFLSVGLFIASG